MPRRERSSKKACKVVWCLIDGLEWELRVKDAFV